jgi:exosortase B
MYGPTYMALNDKVWSVVGQGHGPLMLALALWLAWQRLPALNALDRRVPLSALVVAWACVGVGLVMYVVGRSQSHYGFDAGSQLPLLIGLVLLYAGWPGLKVMCLPLVFVMVLVPLPGSLIGALTGPLKSAVSYVAAEALFHLGYPVGREGVTLSIGPYKLLVADACAGLNSIFALEAVGVFYMSLRNHASTLRNVLLSVFIVPISFLANVVRVMVLVLITFYFGDEAGQGFVHGFSGILLMGVATIFTIMLDAGLGFFFKARAPAEAVVKGLA